MKLDIEKFISLPFNKQVHVCCAKWCENNKLNIYENGKLTRSYWRCRAYLMKLPTQTIKNICMMLFATEKPYSLFDLEEVSKRYVGKRQSEVEKEKVEAITEKKEYDIDLEAFLK